MVLLIKCQLDESEFDGNGDSIVVEAETYATIEEARERMRTEVLQLVAEGNRRMREDGFLPALDADGNPFCLDEGEDYEIKEDDAWLAWPHPHKWKIVSA